MVEDKFMRVLVMFDLPTKTKKDRQTGTKFRNNLIKLGFFMMQFSVYMRICKGSASAQAAINNVRKFVPPRGSIRCLIITEKQFDSIEILLGGVGFNEMMDDPKNLVLFGFDEKKGEYVYADNDKDSDEEKLLQTKSKKTRNIQGSLFEF